MKMNEEVQIGPNHSSLKEITIIHIMAAATAAAPPSISIESHRYQDSLPNTTSPRIRRSSLSENNNWKNNPSSTTISTSSPTHGSSAFSRNSPASSTTTPRGTPFSGTWFSTGAGDDNSNFNNTNNAIDSNKFLFPVVESLMNKNVNWVGYRFLIFYTLIVFFGYFFVFFIRYIGFEKIMPKARGYTIVNVIHGLVC